MQTSPVVAAQQCCAHETWRSPPPEGSVDTALTVAVHSWSRTCPSAQQFNRNFPLALIEWNCRQTAPPAFLSTPEGVLCVGGLEIGCSDVCVDPGGNFYFISEDSARHSALEFQGEKSD